MRSSVTPSRRATESRFLSVLVLPQFVCLVFVLSVVAVPSASAQPSPALATTIERVMAVVDGHPLLLSDVNDLSRLRGLEAAAALEAAIDERLMFFEASRLTQTEVLADEEERALDELLERRPILREQVGEPGLRRILRRQITILKYVEFRFRPQLRVSDQEVRAAFEADPAAGASFEAEKAAIRERLERRALDERVEAWVRELRGRAEVRYVDRASGALGP
jgi:hypothetical protein